MVHISEASSPSLDQHKQTVLTNTIKYSHAMLKAIGGKFSVFLWLAPQTELMKKLNKLGFLGWQAQSPHSNLSRFLEGGDCSSESRAAHEDPDTPPRIRLTPPPGEVPLSVTPAETSEVLADIFKVSLTQAAVPTCLKTATIIPVPKSSTVTGLNDYRPIALTPIVTKCFERLVMTHIKATIDVTVDPHQYAYRKNQSTDDAISSLVHTALTHLEQKDSYVRMLFVDFTSVFNTMIPQTLTDKLSSLGLCSSLCNWVLDFLTNRPQSVRIHNLTSSTTILSTGSPQGCVLSPLLFTLLTYDCSPIHPGCLIEKFVDDTAVVGCITNSDESGHRQEVEHLEGWCRKNNLCINVKKTKEIIVDFRRGRHAHLPLHVGGSVVEVISNYRRLRRAGLGSSVLTSFYRCVVESVVCSSINMWHGSCSAADMKDLQRVVKAAQRSVGVSLPTTTDIYASRCRRRATSIMKDPTHPAHALFVPLPSGRRLRSIKCKANRLRNSFIPKAVSNTRPKFINVVLGMQISSLLIASLEPLITAPALSQLSRNSEMQKKYKRLVITIPEKPYIITKPSSGTF
ncbi:hypothetical protein NFI96_002224 [Prochilodus magdalenae]|nr:hypothetical protein NFI96_002224 [Prochilodus magdalenae]